VFSWLAASALVLAACGSNDDDSGSGGSGFERVEGFPEAGSLFSVWSFAPDDVWIAADAGRMFHYTGDWEVVNLPGSVTVVDLWSPAPGELVGVGGFSVVRYDGSTWEVEDLSDQNLGFNYVSAVWAAAPDDVWIVGDQSTVAHFDGVAWTRTLAAGPDNEVVWGTGAGSVYTASVFDTARYDGTTWAVIDEISSGGSAIFGFGEDDVWVADGDTLWHWNGGGWTEQESNGFGDIQAMWGETPDDLWGAGDFGAIMHYDGDAWREVDSQPIGAPYLRIFSDVHGSGSGDIWAVGNQLGDDGNTPVIYRN